MQDQPKGRREGRTVTLSDGSRIWVRPIVPADRDELQQGLERLSLERGTPPAFVRFDHGPEFIAHPVADWCRFHDTDSVFIDPGSPWQIAWIESFNGRLRDEQHQPTPHRPRRPHPHRVRHPLDHHQPNPSRITPGPLTGSPSTRYRACPRREVGCTSPDVSVVVADAGLACCCPDQKPVHPSRV